MFSPSPTNTSKNENGKTKTNWNFHVTKVTKLDECYKKTVLKVETHSDCACMQELEFLVMKYLAYSRPLYATIAGYIILNRSLTATR